MPGWYELDLEEEKDEQSVADADQGLLGAGLSLDDLMNSEDAFISDFAKRLAELKTARAEREERERLAMEGQVAVQAGNVDYDDPALVPALLALVEDRRAAAEQIFLRNTPLALRQRGVPEDEIEKEMVAYKAQAAGLAEFMGPPSLSELPEYREFQRQKVERAKAAQLAIDYPLRDVVGFETDLAEANAGIEASLLKASSRG